MAKKVYKTQRGKQLDMGAFVAKNDRVVAVGNMNVNARGDEVDGEGNIIRSRAEIMKDYHNLHTMVPSDEPAKTETAESLIPDPDDGWADFEPKGGSSDAN